MENLKIDTNKNYCNISKTKIYNGDNNELIYIKIYQGDWGDWDDEPSNTTTDTTSQKFVYDKTPDAEK
ncbi:hypothetical protein [Flavobacterium sp. 245]|uniref:hypothetical protein n=1 Tax=Flavobacterium sp. 245 TaxID=2512115 RepID=UPI00105CBFE0|nr:hypothetical protein [Flavobacterium sp. 245]TDP03173.1 hypothetical protein EV145_102336 [Flavobacterium sp. 245]